MSAPAVSRAGSASAEMAEARAQFTRGNEAGALNLAVAVLKKDPRSFEAYQLLGELSLKKAGGGPVAEKMLRQALVLRPRDLVAQQMLAAAFAAQGKLREAGEQLDRVLKERPRDLATLLALAKVREATKQFSAAEALLRSSVQHHPDAVVAAAALGDYLKRQGQLDEALVWHRRVVGSTETTLPAVTTGRRHALFLVQLDAAWASLASAYAALAADPEWLVTVVALPFLHCHYSTEGERMAVFAFLQKEGIPFLRWDEFVLEPGCADVAFFHMPYDETLPAGWRSTDVLRAVPRIVYISYAVVVIASEENMRYQFNLPLQQRAWMVVAHSRSNHALFSRHCATGNVHVVVTGHPKTDSVRHLPAAGDAELARLGTNRKIICWNPHFDMRPNGTAWGSGPSTFLHWQGFMLDEFARRPDLALVIRPHPLFFSSLEKRRLWTAAEVAAFFARVEGMDNVLIDRRPTYLPVFAASTAMLSDASSLLLEYSVTGKPLLYLRNPQGPAINDADFVREHLYTGEDEGTVREFLDMVARGEDPRGPARRAALPEFMHAPPEGAGVALKLEIEKRLSRETTARPGQSFVSPQTS